MKLIASADKNWGIGKNGGLLLHIPEDMQRFRAITMGNTVVMGRKTLESLPGGRPLEGRKNIVLTRNKNYEIDGALICHSVEELEAAADGEVFVIGGGEIYSLLLDKCDTAYITHTDMDDGADTFLPVLDDKEWEIIENSEEHEYNGIKFRFITYIRR